MHIQRIAALGIVATLAVTAACGGGSDSPSAPTPTTPTVSSITVSGYTGPFTAIGQTVTLKATANMSNGSAQDVTSTATWTSDATGVATVSGAGVVTARSAGDATIVANTQGVIGTTRVTVNLPREAVPVVSGGLDVTRSPEPAFLFRSKVTAIFSETGGTTGYSVNFINVTWKDYQGQTLLFHNYTPGDLQRIWGSNFVPPGGRQGIEAWIDYNATISRTTTDVVISITDSLGNSRTYNATFTDSVDIVAPQSLRERSSQPARFAGDKSIDR